MRNFDWKNAHGEKSAELIPKIIMYFIDIHRFYGLLQSKKFCLSPWQIPKQL